MNTDIPSIPPALRTGEHETIDRHEFDALKIQFTEMEGRFREAQRRFRTQRNLALFAIVGAALCSPALRPVVAQGYGVTLATLNARLAVVEAKTRFQSADNVVKSTTFRGCNVFVNNGSGATGTILTNSAGEGLGNLILGYNATGHFDVINGQNYSKDIHTGSHNLILGDQENYTDCGGLILGRNNTISGFSDIVGGIGNTADGTYAFVTGNNNTAIGFASSVSGGTYNTASGNYASISGGVLNKSSGLASSISGGDRNTASGDSSSISGGAAVIQSVNFAWSGGSYHTP